MKGFIRFYWTKSSITVFLFIFFLYKNFIEVTGLPKATLYIDTENSTLRNIGKNVSHSVIIAKLIVILTTL